MAAMRNGYAVSDCSPAAGYRASQFSSASYRTSMCASRCQANLARSSCHTRSTGFTSGQCVGWNIRATHATELVNEGVSLNTIRKRLGHKNLQTTLCYADQSDATADAELRA